MQESSCSSSSSSSSVSVATSPTSPTSPAISSVDLSVPSFVTLVQQNNVQLSEVSREEIKWMVSKRPVTVFERSRLDLDYGAEDAQAMVAAFEKVGARDLLSILNWPGVGTRYEVFLKWWEENFNSKRQKKEDEQETKSLDNSYVEDILWRFANYLGRVTSYRALALDRKALDNIFKVDEIFPSGQLHKSAAQLAQVIEDHGVRKVAVCRLYIAHLRAKIGFDPSISLHDDWQTTTCIASTYAVFDKLDPTRSRPVYLFECSVPVVESLGWTVCDVAHRSGTILGPKYGTHEPWFEYASPAAPEGVWFDATAQRTERYGFYAIPFLRARLSRLWQFSSQEQIRAALDSFIKHQAQTHKDHPEGLGK